MIALIIWWMLVTANCEGGPEDIDHYEVRWSARRIIGSQECDPTGVVPGMCPIYSPFSWSGPVSVIEPPVDTLELDLEPGEVFVYEVTAVDKAMNRDCGL